MNETRNVATLAARASSVAVVMALVCADARPQSVASRGGEKRFEEAPEPTVVAEVSDPKALGYVGNRKFFVDAQGTAYCAIRSRGPQGLGICLLRSTGRWPDVGRFDSAWLENSPGVEVSTAPQRHPTIAATSDGTIHLAWYGGSALKPAHQIRYARFSSAGALRPVEEIEPFSVAGFEQVYTGLLSGDELWQEHPCLAAGPNGLLYLVWEARDPSRRNALGAPQPAIAWAVRDADGRWSVSGAVDAPPYAEVGPRFPSQSRPTIVSGAGGEMHVFCYGSVSGVQQVLHGVLRDRAFSGWSVVCPSAGDQRHVSAASDPTGRVHLAWREGTAGAGGAAPSVGVYYASLDPAGRVDGPLRVSPAGENGSTPSIIVSRGAVWIAWVSWTPGEVNSEGKPDNGFPADAASVEGRLQIRSRPNRSSSFGPVIPLAEGPVSYPTWACRSDANRSPEALLWIRTDPGGRYELLLSRVTLR